MIKCFQKSLWKGASGGLIDQRSLHLVISCLKAVSQLSDFKEVFDRLFWTFIKTRKLIKMNSFLMGKLSRSIFNQSGSILFALAPLLYAEKCVLHELYQSPFVFYFMNTHCIVESPEGKHFKNGSNLSHSPSQTVVFFG